MRVDIYGFGEVIHRTAPSFWKNNRQDWDHQFASIPIEVKVNVDVRNLGLFNY